MTSDLIAVSIISADKPFTVPAGRKDGFFHGCNFAPCAFCLIFFINKIADICVFITIFYKHSGYKYRFGYRSF